MARATLVGTTGWSHPEWVGPVYPVHLRAKPEAWLAQYATRFRTVEVASSFDAFPDADLVASWARAGVALQGRGAFEFSLKLPRDLTHEALARGDVDEARERAGQFDREVLDPLAGEGLLGVVLAQLPPSFEASPENAFALTEALAPLAERKVAVELRSPTWVDNGCLVPGLDRLFASGDVCLVEADLPGAVDARTSLGARHAYLRFHGRREDLWAIDGARDGRRYDYLYGRDELAPWVERVRAHERAGREVRAYFNNAPRAQAVANAVDLVEMLGAPAPPARPRLTAQQRLPL
jgi:uncharacterized protein YecE (DUF72 family)